MDLEKMIELYEVTAILYGEAMEKGDYSRACLCLEKNEKAFHRLQEYGRYGSVALLNLLDHHNPFVKISAATHLLGTFKNQSIEILEQLARHPGFQGFNAQMVLEDFNNGDLVVHKFDTGL